MVNLPPVPANLQSCPGLPPKPAPTADARAISDWIVQLRIAHRECKGDLEALNTYIDTLRAELNT